MSNSQNESYVHHPAESSTTTFEDLLKKQHSTSPIANVLVKILLGVKLFGEGVKLTYDVVTQKEFWSLETNRYLLPKIAFTPVLLLSVHIVALTLILVFNILAWPFVLIGQKAYSYSSSVDQGQNNYSDWIPSYDIFVQFAAILFIGFFRDVFPQTSSLASLFSDVAERREAGIVF